jgi:hypothetical protein
MRIQEYHKKEIDTTELFLKFREQFEHVYIYQIDDQVYFYRPLNRSEYRKVGTSDLLDIEKEDYVVSTCILYPENIDIDNSEAGLISKLAELIIECSYLTKEQRHNVVNFYRQEMTNIDNQITCVIHEAFQNIDLEDIEQWDVEKTMKYLSRSEWVLHNLRGIPVNPEAGEQADLGIPEFKKVTNPLEYDLPKEPEPEIKEKPVPEPIKPEVTHRGTKKSPLTPEKLAELQAKYPGIDWAHDDGLKGIEGLEQPDVHEKPPALRPRNTIRPPKIDAENIYNH